MINFCHIAPIPYLNLVSNRKVHLVLAHLIEQSPEYVDFYLQEKNKYKSTIILDNSGFEMYKQNKPMYSSDRLVSIGETIQADYIVLSDYPAEHSSKTIDSAIEFAPRFKQAGFKTFFVPQSRINDLDDCINSFKWASDNPQLIDYIGVSILTAPNVFGVETGNKMQRFLSRLKLMFMLEQQQILQKIVGNGIKIHFLGMVDGPNEIMFMEKFHKYISTWDSSAAIWAGLNGISFDNSPTGLLNGKFEKEVDFYFLPDSNYSNYNDDIIINNIKYIDLLCKGNFDVCSFF